MKNIYPENILKESIHWGKCIRAFICPYYVIQGLEIEMSSSDILPFALKNRPIYLPILGLTQN